MSLLERAVNPNNSRSELPNPSQVVTTLLTAEKSAKKEKVKHDLSELIGTWRLRFITGTKKTREKAGVVLGSGRYIPNFIKITITYFLDGNCNRHKVENKVRLGSLFFSLTGPVKFLNNKNILAFDFTAIEIGISNFTIYRGYIRGGQEKEESFYREKIGKQAFFAYFLITPNAIAARGRGGGLALWGREEPTN